MKARILAVGLVLASLSLNACDGNDCAALTNPLSDGDSDCIEDSGDNCPGIANFDQTDLDSDGVGAACDSNDADENVASISADAPAAAIDLTGTYTLQVSTCSLADNNLEVTQSETDVTVSGDRNGEYDASLTTDEESITYLSIQQSGQTCDAQVSSATTLSFYCHSDADTHSDGCANIFERF